jgi:hypothetical protein
MTVIMPDAADVKTALRLGWLMAEVRGRARPDGPGKELAADMARGHWVLPAGSERSVAELQVEAEHALAAVAKSLAVDPLAPVRGDAAATCSEQACRLGRAISAQRKQHDPREQTTWNQIARLLYHWDAAIQDELLSRSDRLANGYELGRILAETYWALDPAAPPRLRQGSFNRLNPVSWDFLLGPDRRADAAQMLARLAPYFAPLAAPAVAGSVEVWGQVAADPVWRAVPGTQDALLRQIRNWYSLLVAGLDPETMLRPYALLRSWRIFKRAFRAFGQEMVIAVAGVAAFGALALLITYRPNLPLLTAIVGLLGAIGVTGAGLQARLKATTQSVIARLSADLSTELVAEQITITPAPPAGVNGRRARLRGIAARSVTAPLGR